MRISRPLLEAKSGLGTLCLHKVLLPDQSTPLLERASKHQQLFKFEFESIQAGKLLMALCLYTIDHLRDRQCLGELLQPMLVLPVLIAIAGLVVQKADRGV